MMVAVVVVPAVQVSVSFYENVSVPLVDWSIIRHYLAIFQDTPTWGL